MASAAADARSAAELAEVRAFLLAHLQHTVPILTAETAQLLLEGALAWSPRGARRLAEHLREYPAAFTSGSAHCPTPLPRLLRLLDTAGHGQDVTLIGCARCGRTDRRLDRLTDNGRCCAWCVERDDPRRCARCGRTARLMARRDEGTICQRCYTREDGFRKECAECGNIRVVRARRREDGASLCPSCAPAQDRQCSRCGQVRRPVSQSAEDPICGSCYHPPPRRCGICGELRPLRHKGGNGRPPSCTRCYRNRGECVVCGRIRHGSKLGGGEFHCSTCRPYRPSQCTLCGQPGRVRAIWPLGTVCAACYQRRDHNPARCADCGTVRVLVGVDPHGLDVCGRCCGYVKDYDCSRCGQPGQQHSTGRCARCVARDRLHDLLSNAHGDSVVPLQPLTETLADAQPWSLLSWMSTSPAAQLLASLIADGIAIDHGRLDHLPQDATTASLRQILVHAGVLPERQERLHQLRLWLGATLTALPTHQRALIGPFAEWSILRDARRRAERGTYTSGAAAADQREIRVAIGFLDWLDDIRTPLDRLQQGQIDKWLEVHPAQHRYIIAFLRWTVARRLTPGIDAPKRRQRGQPSRFLSEQELHDQLRRCLLDDALPLEVRIIGALVRLYAIPVVRVLELTTDQFSRVEGGDYLTVRRHPVLLPPRLADLIEAQISHPRVLSNFTRSPGVGPAYLFPGHQPGRPRNATSVHLLLAKYDLPSARAHNTAMIEAVTRLPPIVVADLFGLGRTTVHDWAQLAQQGWADYIAGFPPSSD